MIDVGFITDLRKRLELRSGSSHSPNSVMGYPRATSEEARKLSPPPRESAVMFLFYPKGNEWHTMFMKRPEGQGIHSNQLSFPGGKIEPGESGKDAAIRETNEEVGIHPGSIELIGKLTELYIPPSHFIVEPFVGMLDETPTFLPNPDEVAEVIECPVSLFLQHKIIVERKVFVPKFNKEISARCFEIRGHILWGATAMMVQEFREMYGYIS